MGRLQQQSLGSAWDRPVEPAAVAAAEPAVLGGQQLQQQLASAASAAVRSAVFGGQQQQQKPASAAVRSAVAPSAAEEGPAVDEASLSSH